jgi:hypothetical protein
LELAGPEWGSVKSMIAEGRMLRSTFFSSSKLPEEDCVLAYLHFLVVVEPAKMKHRLL